MPALRAAISGASALQIHRRAKHRVGIEVRPLVPEIGGGDAEHLLYRLVEINDAVVLVREQHVAGDAVEADLHAHAFGATARSFSRA